MRPDQLNAMFDLVGLDKESFLEALHQLKSDLYSEKWWVRDNLDQFTSAIVAYLVYCYVPGLPEDMRIVRFASALGDPHWFIAFPKEKVECFDPLVHIEAAYEGVRYVIVDLAGEQREKNYQYEPGYIMTEIMRYWPGRNVQLLAKMLGYDYKDPVRCSRGWMPSPDLEDRWSGQSICTKYSRTLNRRPYPELLMRRIEMRHVESASILDTKQSFFIQ